MSFAEFEMALETAGLNLTRNLRIVVSSDEEAETAAMILESYSNTNNEELGASGAEFVRITWA